MDIFSWTFYLGLPGIFVVIYLLKANVPAFQQWWYNNVSIGIMRAFRNNHDEGAHSHEQGHQNQNQGHGHSHAHGHQNEQRHKEMADTKRTLFKDLDKIVSKDGELKKKGAIRILEIGTGFGANFQFYPENCNLIALDAHDGFKEKLLDNLKKYPGINLEQFVHRPAENMEGVKDSSVDVVIGTAVFCQVKSMAKVFKEIQRVLVPGGRFYYIEHIAAEPNTLVGFFQTVLTKSGIMPLFTQGHLDRKMDQDILNAQFSNVNQKYIEFTSNTWFSKLSQRNVIGVATK